MELLAKLEMQNLFGMKDRVARNILVAAEREGVLRAGDPIVESSSGTMALGVALVGVAMGHPVHIVTDPRIDPVPLVKLRAVGCEVWVVPAMTSNGWQSARLERLAELMADLPGAFWPRQYSNPDNPAAYAALAAEILDDVGPVDVLVGSVGSGGSLCGASRALRRSLPDLRVVGVDCVGSALFDQPDVPGRLQSGLGNSLWPKNLDRRLIDEVHWLNDLEAFAATRDLAREQQLFAGNTSGSVYRVMGDLAERSAPGTRIVGIFDDRGDRYAGTVYSDEHWQAHRLADLDRAGTPAVGPYGAVVRRWSRARNEAARATPQHLVFVESNTTGTGMLALRRTAALGFRPVLLTNDPGRYLGLADTGCEVVGCDTTSARALLEVVRDRFHREELAGVTSTSEFAVPAVAELATRLGLPGNRRAAVDTCRNKAALRQALDRAAVCQPRFATVGEGAGVGEVAAAVARVGLPCVVKPVDDSGSNLVLLCRSAGEVARQVAAILAVRTNARGMPTARTVLVEEYLDGPEVSVEMFGWRGAHHCVGVVAKSVGPLPHFVEMGHVVPSTLPPAQTHRVEQVVRATLNAAGIDFGATHTELRLTARGPAVIEVNPRPAGGMIPELIALAAGVDVVEQHLRAALDLPVALESSRARVAGIRFLAAGQDGVLARVDGVERARKVPGVERVTLTAGPGAAVRVPRSSYDRLGHVIAVGDDHAAVEEALREAVGLISVMVDDERGEPQ